MSEMSDELLARIAKRAADPNRRYMTAAEDQSSVELPTGEIQRRFDDVGDDSRRCLPDDAGQDARVGLRLGEDELRRAERRILRGVIKCSGGSTVGPAANRRRLGQRLERIVGRPMPEDLKRLYSISDGGFGPGFTGLNPVQRIGSFHEDLRQRGPDYCGTVEYPASFLPIAGEMLDYHYDLDTGRISLERFRLEQSWARQGRYLRHRLPGPGRDDRGLARTALNTSFRPTQPKAVQGVGSANSLGECAANAAQNLCSRSIV